MRWLFQVLLGLGRADPGAAPPDPLRIQRILLVRPNHRLGNTVLLSPTIVELRRLFPHAEVDVLGGGSAGPTLLARFPHVINVFSIPTRVAHAPLEPLRVIRAIRKRQYDLAIDVCPESQTGRVYTLLTKARYRLGYEHPQKLEGLTHSLPPADPEAHAGLVAVDLVRRVFGVQRDRWPPMALPLSARERRVARRRMRDVLRRAGLQSRPTIVGLYGHATGAKRLKREWWNPLLERLERDPSLAIVEILPGHGESCYGWRYPAIFASDPRPLAAVVSCLDLFVSADGGVMHLSAAVRTPTVGLFCITSARKYGPYGRDNLALDIRQQSPAGNADLIVAHLAEVVRRRDAGSIGAAAAQRARGNAS